MATTKISGFRFFWVSSKYVSGNYPKFLGVALSDEQVRVGLIWWHTGVLFPDFFKRTN